MSEYSLKDLLNSQKEDEDKKPLTTVLPKSLKEVLDDIESSNSAKKIANKIDPLKSTSAAMATFGKSGSLVGGLGASESAREAMASLTDNGKLAASTGAMSEAMATFGKSGSLVGGLGASESAREAMAGFNKTSTENIHKVANSLAKLGQRPTLAAVRKELGGGSFTTISDAMRSWREEQEEQDQALSTKLPSDIAHKLHTLGVSFWDAANSLSKERLDDEYQALRAMKKNMLRELAEAEDNIRILEEENKQSKAELKQLKKSHEHVRSDATIHTKEVESLREELANCHSQITEQNSQIKTLLGQQQDLVGILTRNTAAAKDSDTDD